MGAGAGMALGIIFFRKLAEAGFFEGNKVLGSYGYGSRLNLNQTFESPPTIMLQHWTMLLHRERLRIVGGPLSLIRRFSATRSQAKDNTIEPTARGTRRDGIPPANLTFRNANADRPRPRRIVDARSLAASRAAGQPAIIKGPRARSPRNGRPAFARSPRAATKTKIASKDRRQGRSQDLQEPEEVSDELYHEAAINAVFRELTEQAQPKPVRYAPHSVSLPSLRETWPSFPTNIRAHTAGVVEKLSLFSDRFPNGYVPSYELGRRLYQGKYVHFSSEQEKSEAISEANMLSQKRADKISQQKGDLVDPDHVNFSPINAKDQNTLVGLVVKGIYPKPEAKREDKLSVLDKVSENLRNNATYQTVGKSSAFIAKLDSLLASSRPTKRT
ncbi:uncharacterized protein BO80DRAFT_434420 [Aspergillus ibericus CBS 121593]|uniref:Uncharacterized protein n=1 Tax=Aspergillus ibericus CBS 121593 TaxID=1448316 RepID=A0A395H1N1_9EURO|nr:hypothetical protein BO80DRAFT_434420 [Aspergillus ibericus CBS 121593]RAL01500.1 hypothetical protein BO80DRAFT_434420 [Aspergillus ibericus CBS 121593]